MLPAAGKLKFDVEAIDMPRRWKRGRIIFVNSMSDLFHDAVLRVHGVPRNRRHYRASRHARFDQ
jgi:protein gp37